MSIEEKLNNLHDLFSIFEDRKDQFIQLMDMAKDHRPLRNKDKVESNKIITKLKKGSMISVHSNTVHGSLDNTSKISRYSADKSIKTKSAS